MGQAKVPPKRAESSLRLVTIAPPSSRCEVGDDGEMRKMDGGKGEVKLRFKLMTIGQKLELMARSDWEKEKK